MPPFPFLRKEKILPLNLGYLAAVIPKDITVEVLDANLLELTPRAFARKVGKLTSDVLLFTGHTYQMPFVAKAASMAKQSNPTTITVVGGPHVTQVPEETLRRYPSLDLAVVGEGEHTLVELLRTLRAADTPADVKGIVYRKADELIRTPRRDMIEDLDSIPFPAWHYFKIPAYSSFYPLTGTSIPIMTTRGCPFRCKFCNRALGDRVRFRGLASVCEEIERALSMGIRELEFADESFTLVRERVLAICEYLIHAQENGPISWVTQTRVDLIDEETVTEMARAGCAAINFGIESGSQEVLDALGKGITVAQIKKAIALCKKARIKSLANVLVGTPADTPRTLMETERLVLSLKPDRLAVNQLVAFPGTEFYAMALRGEQGMALRGDDWGSYHPQKKSNLKVPGVTQHQITLRQTIMYCRFYLLQPNRSTLLQLLSIRSLAQYFFSMMRSLFR